MHRAKGFTLIELLIVVAIIAILALIAVPNFLEAQIRAKVGRAKADMRSLATAIEAYHVDENAYPPAYSLNATLFYLEQRWKHISTPIAYISSIPDDPFGDRVDFSLTAPPFLYRVFDFVVDVPDWPGQHMFFERLEYYGYSTEIAWYIASQGPDQEPGLANDVDGDGWPDIGLTYDPSNGTVSYGDIIRVGPGQGQLN